MNSDTLVDEFLRGLNETSNHETKHFYVNEMNITPCQGCLYCATSEGHSCRIKDDMQEVYSAYRDSDLVVWASPMYWGYLTAQVKTVQDRMEALAWSGFEDKTFAVIITYRHHYQSALGMFQRITPHFNIKLHSVVCQTYDPEKRVDLPISACEQELKESYNLGRKLGR